MDGNSILITFVTMTLVMSAILFIFINSTPKMNKQHKFTPNTNKHLIKSSTCNSSHPSVIKLFIDDKNGELSLVWNDIIKDFDQTTYSFSTIIKDKCKCDKECEGSHEFWKIDKVPCIRSYGMQYRCMPHSFDEYKGNFDKKSIREFIMSK